MAQKGASINELYLQLKQVSTQRKKSLTSNVFSSIQLDLFFIQFISNYFCVTSVLFQDLLNIIMSKWILVASFAILAYAPASKVQCNPSPMPGIYYENYQLPNVPNAQACQQMCATSPPNPPGMPCIVQSDPKTLIA